MDKIFTIYSKLFLLDLNALTMQEKSIQTLQIS